MKKYLLILCLTLLLTLAACGGSGSTTETDPPSSDPVTELTSETADDTTATEATTIPIEEPQTMVYDDGITADSGETTPPAETGRSYHFTLDCEAPIGADDKQWFVNSTAKFLDGTLTSDKGQHFYVSEREKIVAETYTVTVDIKSYVNDAPFVTGYIGLRLPNFDDEYIATSVRGLWLAVRNNTIGLLTGTWPTTEYMTIPYSFQNFRRLYIEDNTVDNVVFLYVDDDNGNRAYVGRVVIDGTKAVLCNADNKACVTANAPAEIESSGYVCFWGHLNGGVYYDNLSIKWQEQIQTPYVPSDPAGIRELYADAWVAADDLDRTVDNVEGAVTKDKLVGMFYQLWHESISQTYPDQILYDHTAAFREGGVDAVYNMLTKGTIAWPHYWAEPYFGYYVLTDKWVIRKHASMLSDIGVDFIYLDVTNGQPFTTNYMTIFREFKNLRDLGVDTPDIAFFLGVDPEANVKVFDDLWTNLYENDLYSELYCLYEGGILLLGDTSAIDKSKLEKFTVRDCWALNDQINGGKDKWSWMTETPQTPSYVSATGEIEEISISAGLLVNTSVGRSYTLKGGQPKLDAGDDFQFRLSTTPYGLFFAEQMEVASQYDPPVLLITAWNEWTAGRWETEIKGVLIANTYTTLNGEAWSSSYYVDAFNPEFSRDIEPMRNADGYGFGDNYYYQLAAYLRKFKGSRPALPVAGQAVINIDGDIAQWDSVFPEYRDTAGDTYHRNASSWNNYYYYSNETGRNDILSAKVSVADGNAYFLVTCADAITAPTGTNWMNLYIDTDADPTTGWSGFEYVLCRSASVDANGKGTATVARFKGDTFDAETIGEADIRLTGSYLQIKVSTALVGINGAFHFKWADNSTDTGDAMAFLDLGDAAPNARFAYDYDPTSDGALQSELSPYLAGGAAFRTGSCYVAADGKLTILDTTSDHITPMYHEKRIFVPAQALTHVSGITVTSSNDGKTVTLQAGDKTLTFSDGKQEVAFGIHTVILPVAPYMENGQLYIPLNATAHYLGYHYADAENGCAIITPTPIEHPDSITELIRRTL